MPFRGYTHACKPLWKLETPIANNRHAANLAPALQKLACTFQLMWFLEVAQAVKLQVLKSRKNRGPMESPGSGVKLDARNLPSSDLRPDPSGGLGI